MHAATLVQHFEIWAIETLTFYDRNAEEWPARADALWRAHRDRIDDFHRQFIVAGLSRQRKARGSGPKRNIASARLASEWAARHYCLRESWVSIYRSQPAHILARSDSEEGPGHSDRARNPAIAQRAYLLVTSRSRYHIIEVWPRGRLSHPP